MMKKETLDFLVIGEYLLSMENTEQIIKNKAVAIKNGKIVDIGTRKELVEKYDVKREIGGNNKVVMPGFVNTHTHAAMVYFRGIADDLPLKVWLEKYIWPAESKWLGEDFIKDATELACLEMLKSGITLYNDMYFFEDSSAEIIKQVGIRAVLGAGIIDFPTPQAKTTQEYFEKAEAFINKWITDELILPSIAPHAPYSCSLLTYEKSLNIAEKYHIPIHTHISETKWEVEKIKNKYGKTPVEYLAINGLLDHRMIAAHCVWINDSEIEILAEKNVKVAHCIESNLKLASGIAPITKMLKAGIKVTIGTDSAASNNDLDMLSETSTVAKLHKAVSEDPTAINARTALLMATKWGAEAVGLGDKVGTLSKGKEADLIIIDINKPHLMPIYDIYSHIVYAAKSSDVETVMVKGKLLIDNGNPLTIDEKEVLEKTHKWQNKIKS